VDGARVPGPGPVPLVLVVEDRASIRSLLAVALAQEGLRVAESATAEEALAQVAHEPPDLVLLDLLLPGTRGDALIRALRALPETRRTPVLVLSGVEGGLAASRAAGAQDFLAKPFDLDELAARVRRLLAAGDAGGNPAGQSPA
jgi:two-component system phosphate regulon response regulator PhoB